jgi:hypothetical protein
MPSSCGTNTRLVLARFEGPAERRESERAMLKQPDRSGTSAGGCETARLVRNERGWVRLAG